MLIPALINLSLSMRIAWNLFSPEKPCFPQPCGETFLFLFLAPFLDSLKEERESLQRAWTVLPVSTAGPGLAEALQWTIPTWQALP